MRKNPEMYKRNKGKCGLCGSEVGPFAVKTLLVNIKYYECHACQIKALLITEAPSPKKKKVPVSELPENDMVSIQRGLADAKQGRTSAVRLDSPYIP